MTLALVFAVEFIFIVVSVSINLYFVWKYLGKKEKLILLSLIGVLAVLTSIGVWRIIF